MNCDDELTECIKRRKLHETRSLLRIVEDRMQRANEKFEEDMRLAWKLKNAIAEMEQVLWWERFIKYCNTPAWRFKA